MNLPFPYIPLILKPQKKLNMRKRRFVLLWNCVFESIGGLKWLNDELEKKS